MGSGEDWSLTKVENLSRDSPKWKDFVKWNRERILERLERYNNIGTAKEQLKDLMDLSQYQHYKINTVSKYLKQALTKMDDGTYGICTECQGKIPAGRLFHVPGALRCVDCDDKVNT
jgi:RNA polymerase-binding transcription factor DksA